MSSNSFKKKVTDKLSYSGSYRVRSGLVEVSKTSYFLSTPSTESSLSVVRPTSDVTPSVQDL